MVCVGAGTGLGEVYVTNHGEHVAFASEGGMTEFLAHDEEEWKLRCVVVGCRDSAGNIFSNVMDTPPSRASCRDLGLRMCTNFC